MLGTATIALTYAGGTVTLNKVNQQDFGAEYLYQSSTEEYRMKIRHSPINATAKTGARRRHNVELTRTVFGTPGETLDVIKRVYFVIENPRGNSATEDTDELFQAFQTGALAGLIDLYNELS